MEKQIIVSIRCLVYNHEPYLRQCLDGFVMQKTNFRFEAIVHDDCSTDNSAKIIQEYAAKYPDDVCMQLQCYNMGEAGAKEDINNTAYYNKILSYYLTF